MTTRPLRAADLDEWLRMRCALWPTAPRDDLKSEMGDYLRGATDRATLVAERSGGGLCAFIELSIRPFASGCDTAPIGYIEGWWVDADVRRSGVGRALVSAGEAWARELGCTEMASDTEVENTLSQTAHTALGYREAERVVVFVKRIA